MAKSGIFFSPANHVKELAKLKLFKTAPKILKDIRDCSKQLENRKLASWKRNKLKQALQHYSREFEKQLEDGKIKVDDVEKWCADEDSWDVLSGGIIEINDGLAVDVADCDERISGVDHHWDLKAPSSSGVVEGFETDPESMSKGVGARLGFLARKFPKENDQADLEKQLEDWTKAAAKKSGGDPDKLLKAAKEAFKQTLDGKNPAQAAGLNADSYEIASRFVDNDPVDGIKIDSYSEDAAKKAASKVARGISGQIEDAMSKVDVDGKTISGFDSNVVDLAIKDMGGKPTDVYDVFDRSAGKDKVVLQMRSFLVAAEKNPDKAASDLVRLARNDEQKKILASIAAKLKPDTSDTLEKAAKSAGVAIDDYDLHQIGSQAKEVAKTTAKAAGEKAADSEEVQDAVGSVFGNAFTSLGAVRAIAKAATSALNGGKDVVDALGSWKIARGEDADVVAEMKFLVELPDSADYKKSDVRVSVRFSASDMAWHATCLDDRKLQIPEDVVVKKALATEEGKKFRKKALETWKKVLDPESETGKLFALVLTDGEKLGIKLPGETKKTVGLLKKMSENLPEFEKKFVAEAKQKKLPGKLLAEARDDMVSKAKQLAIDAIKRFGTNKAADWLDELLGGQLKDALVKIFSDEKLSKMDDAEAAKFLEELKNDKDFKAGKANSAHQDTKDSATETGIDPKSELFRVVWWSKDKSTSVASILNSVAAEVQKKAVEAEKKKKDLPARLKKAGVQLKQEDLDAYGPALEALVDKGADKKAIEAAVEKMKKEVKESLSRSWKKKPSKFVLESYSPDARRRKRKTEALLESETFLALVCPEELVSEGFRALAGKAFSRIAAMVPDKAKQKMKDFGAKALAVVSDKGVAGILSLAGIGLGVLTGGWGAQLALSAMYAIQRHGKNLKATFDRQFAAFKNSRGVAAQMDFSLAGDEKAKYSMRYYTLDQVWRVLNVADQKKQVKLSRAKAFVDGPEGQKFRKQLKKIWDPLFADSKGGGVDFEALISQVSGIDVDKKALKLYSDFRKNYADIVASCCEKPKIDTRAASFK